MSCIWILCHTYARLTWVFIQARIHDTTFTLRSSPQNFIARQRPTADAGKKTTETWSRSSRDLSELVHCTSPQFAKGIMIRFGPFEFLPRRDTLGCWCRQIFVISNSSLWLSNLFLYSDPPLLLCGKLLTSEGRMQQKRPWRYFPARACTKYVHFTFPPALAKAYDDVWVTTCNREIFYPCEAYIFVRRRLYDINFQVCLILTLLCCCSSTLT